MPLPDDDHVYSAAKYLKELYLKFVKSDRISKSVSGFETTGNYQVVSDGDGELSVNANAYNFSPDFVSTIRNIDGNGSNNNVEAKVEGRVNNDSDTGSWATIIEALPVKPNTVEVFSFSDLGFSEYRVVAKDGPYGSNTIDGAIEVAR